MDRKTAIRVFIAGGLILLGTAAARAGVALFTGGESSLIPLPDPPLKMLSQTLEFERTAVQGYRIGGAGEWRVEARYRLRNPGEAPVKLRLGLPEPACAAAEECPFAGFRELVARVRGQPRGTRIGHVDPAHAWAEHMERVHLFDLTLAPLETVDVSYTYRHDLSEGINGGDRLFYLARGGAQWVGGIEQVRLRIRLPFRPWGMALGDWSGHLTGLSEQFDRGRRTVELEFARSAWASRDDLDFYFGPGRPTLETPALIDGCPAHGQLFDLTIDADAVSLERLEDAVAEFPRERLRLCRNAVFAHHGRAFEEPRLDRFFYGESGLKVHPRRDPGARGVAVFARNGQFVPGLVTPEEIAYAGAIRRIERGH